jgi:hypothetical protein
VELLTKAELQIYRNQMKITHLVLIDPGVSGKRPSSQCSSTTSSPCTFASTNKINSTSATTIATGSSGSSSSTNG